MKKKIEGIEVKKIAGYKHYWVSKCGKVYSSYGRGRWLKPRINPAGYKQINLYIDGIQKTHRIHQLVYFSFTGEPKKGSHNEYQIRHLDGDKLNNNLNNLSYGPMIENIKDRLRLNEGCCAFPGEDHYNAVLTENQVIHIRHRYSYGDITQSELAKKYEIHPSTISLIVNGKQWSHIGGPIKGIDY